MEELVKNELKLDFDSYKNNFSAADNQGDSGEVKLVSALDETKLFKQPLEDYTETQVNNYKTANSKYVNTKFANDFEKDESLRALERLGKSCIDNIYKKLGQLDAVPFDKFKST
jgi:hypothetical protein